MRWAKFVFIVTTSMLMTSLAARAADPYQAKAGDKQVTSVTRPVTRGPGLGREELLNAARTSQPLQAVPSNTCRTFRVGIVLHRTPQTTTVVKGCLQISAKGHNAATPLVADAKARSASGRYCCKKIFEPGAKNIFAAHRLKDANPVKDVPSKICGTASAA